ncbi:YihY/virulence factor BrkB family protein [Nonomuraea sp. NPDC050556]|uniref:YihY/virulence factor BrkB family protein n=1 Tax=Nonomuraea sp. NPDC050556 TaxID=3364369 RepID=UPI00378CC58B
MASLLERVAAIKARGLRLVNHYRVRWPWFDHLLRTVRRYQQQFGDRLAGSVTYFAFLSLFPLLAVAFAVFGFVLASNVKLKDALNQAIQEQLPGIADKLDLSGLSTVYTSVGIIGVVGLLYAGLGAIDALRGALREMYMTTTHPLNFFVGKARDLVSLVMVGLTMIVSSLVSGFATQAADTVAAFLGFDQGDLVASGSVWLVGTLGSLLADWLMFVIVLGWVARPTQPFRVIARGALIGAVGFGLLKQLASLLLGHTMSNPVYGTFAVMVGLLLWINFSARLVLYVAAWTATAGFSPPPFPTPFPSNGSSEP